MRRVLVLGATSSIARSIAGRLRTHGDSVFLAARSSAELERIARDLSIRYGKSVGTATFEATDFQGHRHLMSRAREEMGGLDGVVCALGMLGDQPEDSWKASAARTLVDVNLTAAVSLISLAVDIMTPGPEAFIVGLSSVAGERGRQSNYVYGAAKGGFSIFLDGLRNRLEKKGIRVYTAKLGFVDTAMTYGKEGLFLVAQPEQIARHIVRMLRRSSGVYYLPPLWRLIMLMIRLIPEPIFKRLAL